MTLRRIIACSLIFSTLLFSVVFAQEAAYRMSSRQVITRPRSNINTSDLTSVAGIVYTQQTDVPSWAVSKGDITNVLHRVVVGEVSNIVEELISEGGALPFSTTGFYYFASGATVSLYNASIESSSIHTVGLLSADQTWIKDAEFPATVSTSAFITATGPVGVLTGGVVTAGAGTYTLGSADVGTGSVLRLRTPYIAGPGTNAPPNHFYHQLYRSVAASVTHSVSNTAYSTVPPVNYADSVFEVTNRTVAVSTMVPYTNVVSLTYDDYQTNYLPVVVYTNSAGGTTGVTWQTTVTNISGGVVSSWLTNVWYGSEGTGEDVEFIPEPYYFAQDDAPGVHTSFPWTVKFTFATQLMSTNITDIPFYTYTNAAVTVTNPSPCVIPDHGYVGVPVTNYVDIGFAPGVLRTNIHGRCYINEPDAVKPVGSGTKSDPFIMSVPENFRWVRENHKPGGMTGETGDSVPDNNDIGGVYTYENPPGTLHGGTGYSKASYMSRMEYPSYYWATNGAMDSMRTFCVQTNDIDMLQTYLWNYNQFTNAPFVTGFPGISGVPVPIFAGEMTNQIPAQYVHPGGTYPDYAELNAVTNTAFAYGEAAFLLGSYYASRTWPNKRWIHQIHYDGRGHSLRGIWVNGGGRVATASRGLLGAVSVSPTVENLDIGGCISGTVPIGESNHPGSSAAYRHRTCIYYGGLFGTVLSGVRPLWSDASAPLTNLYENIAAFTAPEYCTLVSNCTVFADIDVSVSIESNATATTRNPMIRMGGLFGIFQTYKDFYSSRQFVGGQFRYYGLNWYACDRPAFIYSNAVLGQRLLYSPFPEVMVSCGRISGPADFRGFRYYSQPDFYDTIGNYSGGGSPSMYLPFGKGTRVYDNIFLNNVFINVETNLVRAAGLDGRKGYIQYTDGLDEDGTTVDPKCPMYMGVRNPAMEVYLSSSGEWVPLTEVTPVTTNDYLATDTRGSRLGYYGSVDIVAPRDSADTVWFRYNISAAGNYGAATDTDYIKDYAYGWYEGEHYNPTLEESLALNVAWDRVRLSPYQAVAGESAFRVIHRGNGPTDPDDAAWGYCLVSIDGTGTYAYSDVVPYSFKYGTGGVSTVVINGGLLRDEHYDSAFNRARTDWDWLFQRFSTANLRVSGVNAMTNKYVVEPGNNLGGGGITHDTAYPYSGYDDTEWTRSGELDGWYPVPVNVAGIDAELSSTVVTNNYIVGTNDLGNGLQEATGSWDAVTSETRDLAMLYTNYYAVDAEYINSLTCRLTVVSQVYKRGSYSEDVTTKHVDITITNRVNTYTGGVSVAGTFVATHDVGVGGDVYRVDGDSVEAFPQGYRTAQEPSEYAMIRLTGTNATPVTVSPFVNFVTNTATFSYPAVAETYLEWWPDYASTTGLSAWVVNAAGVRTNLDSRFLYRALEDGDTLGFAGPDDLPGFVIFRAGHPTNGLVAAGAAMEYPDAVGLTTNTNFVAIAQVSFTPYPSDTAYMAPVPGSFWTTNYYGTATNLGEVTTTAAYIDGTNTPYAGGLRVDIYNAAGASMDDNEFFSSVQPYCNYSKPEYLIPGGPHWPTRMRTSDTDGYLLYDIYARQLVTLHAMGSLGSSVTMTLIEGSWPVGWGASP